MAWRKRLSDDLGAFGKGCGELRGVGEGVVHATGQRSNESQRERVEYEATSSPLHPKPRNVPLRLKSERRARGVVHATGQRSNESQRERAYRQGTPTSTLHPRKRNVPLLLHTIKKGRLTARCWNEKDGWVRWGDWLRPSPEWGVPKVTHSRACGYFFMPRFRLTKPVGFVHCTGA